MTTKAKKLFLFIGILTGILTACLGLETKHSNHLGWALLFTGTAFTAIGCMYLGGLFIQVGGKQQVRDRSLWLPGLGVMIISLVTPLEYLFLPPVLPRSDYLQDTGLILFAGGLILYLLSQQSPELWKAPENRSTFQRKPSFMAIWRILCYPAPISLLLIMFGLGIGYSSLIGLFILFLLMLPGLINRIKMDHRQIIE